MMINRIVLVLFTFLCLSTKGFTTSMEFLNMTIGARPTALGGAFSALADDVNTINYNPAGLVNVSSFQVEYTHGTWIDTLNYENLAFGNPFIWGNMGLNVFYLHTKPFTETDFSGPVGNEIGYNDFRITLGYGVEISKLSIGGNVKYAVTTLADSKAWYFGFDLGGLYKVYIPSIQRNINFSLVLNNIGSKIKFEKKEEKAPTKIIIGLHFPFLNLTKHKINFAGDYNQPTTDDIKATYSTGLEYILFNIASFRVGYKFNTDVNGITAGIGVKYFNIGFNYALYSFSDLGLNHIFSLNIKFPNKK